MRRALLAGMLAVFLSTLATVAGATPANDIFDAAKIDDLRDLRKLLAAGADPKGLDPDGDTLLIVAIRNDAPRTVDLLLADPKTDLETVNVSNETALMIAAYRKQKDTVEKLLKRGAEVNRRELSWTALHYAASVNARDIVALLLDESAYVDASSPNRTTPLMMAARGGFEDVCRQLVEGGADPSPMNERDVTASDFAKKAGNQPLADWLAAQADAWRAKYGAPHAGTATEVPKTEPAR